MGDKDIRNEEILKLYEKGAHVPMNEKTGLYWIPPKRGRRKSRRKRVEVGDYVYCCRMCGWSIHCDPQTGRFWK